MLDISINLVIIAHVVVSLLLILVILMQRPKQEGLGAAFGSGMTDAAWGARTTDVLQKGTVYLGTLFFLLSLTLGILMGKQNSTKDFASDGATTVDGPAGTPEGESAPMLPTPVPEDEIPEDVEEEPAGEPTPEAAGEGEERVDETSATGTTTDEPAGPAETPEAVETPAETTPSE